MTLYAIRVRDDASGFYINVRGLTLGAETTREKAEEIVRRSPNGHEWEVVEVHP